MDPLEHSAENLARKPRCPPGANASSSHLLRDLYKVDAWSQGWVKEGGNPIFLTRLPFFDASHSRRSSPRSRSFLVPKHDRSCKRNPKGPKSHPGRSRRPVTHLTALGVFHESLEDSGSPSVLSRPGFFGGLGLGFRGSTPMASEECRHLAHLGQGRVQTPGAIPCLVWWWRIPRSSSHMCAACFGTTGAPGNKSIGGMASECMSSFCCLDV